VMLHSCILRTCMQLLRKSNFFYFTLICTIVAKYINMFDLLIIKNYVIKGY
jgi:hypothetical protein